jgi:hypothetical protein
MKSLITIFVTALTLIGSQSFGQIQSPQPSPLSTVSQLVGLTDVTVVYSRPSVKGREIFGSLVAYDKLWRTGANRATKVTFSTDVKVGGQEIKEGSYSLFTIPNQNEWTVIFNSEADLVGTGGYNEDNNVATFKVKSTVLNDLVETFTIDFSHMEGSNGKMNLSWENTRITFDIETNANEMVDEQIRKVLIDGPDAGTYYAAAKHYLDNDKELDRALEWINMAISKRPKAFWYIHVQAKIFAKMGNRKEAVKSATLSKQMAESNEGGDYGYIKLNDDLLEDIRKRK